MNYLDRQRGQAIKLPSKHIEGLIPSHHFCAVLHSCGSKCKPRLIDERAGADPGFWGLINIFTTGGGYGRGRAPSLDSKGVLGER